MSEATDKIKARHSNDDLYETMELICQYGGCGRKFESLDTPGRKKLFCCDNCRQKNHREKKRGVFGSSLKTVTVKIQYYDDIELSEFEARQLLCQLVEQLEK